MTGSVLSPGVAALILFGSFFFFMFIRVPVAFALALACLPILAIEPRLDTMRWDPLESTCRHASLSIL